MVSGKAYNLIAHDEASRLKLTDEQIDQLRHTPDCLAAREKERTERAAYEKRWPGYCRRCDAEGGSSGREYRGECHGTPASEQVFNYCPHCVEQGICPRCGAKWPNENMEGDEFSCYACGWKEGDPGCPEVMNPYDCGCYEDQLGEVGK